MQCARADDIRNELPKDGGLVNPSQQRAGRQLIFGQGSHAGDLFRTAWVSEGKGMVRRLQVNGRIRRAGIGTTQQRRDVVQHRYDRGSREELIQHTDPVGVESPTRLIAKSDGSGRSSLNGVATRVNHRGHIERRRMRPRAAHRTNQPVHLKISVSSSSNMRR